MDNVHIRIFQGNSYKKLKLTFFMGKWKGNEKCKKKKKEVKRRDKNWVFCSLNGFALK